MWKLGSSGGRMWGKRYWFVVNCRESRVPALTCRECFSKIYALGRRRNKAASGVHPLSWPDLFFIAFYDFFSVLTTMWLMALQHGLFKSYGWGWWDWWCFSLSVWNLWKYPLTWLTFGEVHGDSRSAGSMTLEDSSVYWMDRSGNLKHIPNLTAFVGLSHYTASFWFHIFLTESQGYL